MNVKNKRCIRNLSHKQLKASKTRNLIAVFAITLTTLLFTSLFTIALSINDGFQQSNFRQCGGWSHGTFKYLTEEQFEEIKDDPLIKQWGLRRFVGMPSNIGCTVIRLQAACRKKEPMKPQQTQKFWNCWASNLNWEHSSL